MSLINQSEPILCRGVSRQPDHLRRLGQIEDGVNVLLSAVTGGATKRPGTIYVQELLENSAENQEFYVHHYSRNSDERYILIFFPTGKLRIFTYDGSEKVVTGDNIDYLKWTTRNQLTALTIGDTTLVLNRQKVVDTIGPEDTDKEAEFEDIFDLQVGSIDDIRSKKLTSFIFDDSQNPLDKPIGFPYNATFKVNAKVALRYYWKRKVSAQNIRCKLDTIRFLGPSPKRSGENFGTWSKLNITVTVYDYDVEDGKELPAGDVIYHGVLDNADRTLREYTIPIKEENAQFHILCVQIEPNEKLSFSETLHLRSIEFDVTAGHMSGVLEELGPITSLSLLRKVIFDNRGNKNEKAGKYKVQKIYSDDTSLDPTKQVYSYVKYNPLTEKIDYVVNPNEKGRLYKPSLPHMIKRLEDGTFHVSTITWNTRPIGDNALIPDPLFIGHKINDIVLFRDRLCFLVEDKAFFSQARDYFNFWPDSYTQVIDSDPITLSAPAKSIPTLNYAVPYGDSLFVLSPKNQYLINSRSSAVFSPSHSVMDLCFSYRATADVQPFTLGDALYFAEESDVSAVLYECFKDSDGKKETVENITEHIQHYIPAPLRKITGDSVTQTIFVLSQKDCNDGIIYIYKSYWDNSQKAQSAWCKWDFYCKIIDIQFEAHFLWIICVRANRIVLEKLDITYTKYTSTGNYLPCLDQQQILKGEYVAFEGYTQWFSHIKLESKYEPCIVLSEDFKTTSLNGAVYPVSRAKNDARRFIFLGDLSQRNVILGTPYDMSVVLSKVFIKTSDNIPITDGYLSLKYLILTLVDSAYLCIEVQPSGNRAKKKYEFTSYTVGSLTASLSGLTPVKHKEFKIPLIGKGFETTITLRNETVLPCTIVGLNWSGLFTRF